MKHNPRLQFGILASAGLSLVVAAMLLAARTISYYLGLEQYAAFCSLLPCAIGLTVTMQILNGLMLALPRRGFLTLAPIIACALVLLWSLALMLIALPERFEVYRRIALLPMLAFLILHAAGGLLLGKKSFALNITVMSAELLVGLVLILSAVLLFHYGVHGAFWCLAMCLNSAALCPVFFVWGHRELFAAENSAPMRTETDAPAPVNAKRQGGASPYKYLDEYKKQLRQSQTDTHNN
ncbi:MAG: hypothetical protein II920_09385 [Clostridia bacterium]|nr:hypothetical protein [Clostridia bacterium]